MRALTPIKACMNKAKRNVHGCENTFLCLKAWRIKRLSLGIHLPIFDVWEDPIFHDKIGIDGGLGPFEDGQLNCLCLNTKEVFVLKKSEVEETA